MAALARTPILPEATLVGARSALFETIADRSASETPHRSRPSALPALRPVSDPKRKFPFAQPSTAPRRDSGHFCIFIAHNIHHVFQVVDRIAQMRRGRIVANDSTPDDLRSAPAL